MQHQVMTKARDAIYQLFRIKHDRAGNLPPLPGIFPDYMAPIVRRGQDGERELVMARWGVPTPPHFRKGTIDRGVTNICTGWMNLATISTTMPTVPTMRR